MVLQPSCYEQSKFPETHDLYNPRCIFVDVSRIKTMYFQNNVFLGNKHFRGAAAATATTAAAAEEFPVPARPHPITQG